jgi:hypothetical protein
VALSLPNASASVTQVTLPNVAGTFTFRLEVVDTLGRTGEAQLDIKLEAPAAAVSSATGGGGGADRWLWLLLLLTLGITLTARFIKKKGY